MLSRQKSNLKIKTTIDSFIFTLLIMGLVATVAATNALAQSSQSIAPNDQANPNMTGRAIDRTGTAFSGRNSVSIKSTDAGIVPRYQQNSGCINCGTVDFINVIGQGAQNDFITGAIISGAIRNKIFRHGQDQHYPIDPRMGGNTHPDHQQDNASTHYDIGVTMDDGTQTVITHQNAPNFHRGARIKLIDGEFVPHQH